MPKQICNLRDIGSPKATDGLFALASRSSFSVNSYTGCLINDIKWLTYAGDCRLLKIVMFLYQVRKKTRFMAFEGDIRIFLNF